jgi:hypothetical protein
MNIKSEKHLNDVLLLMRRAQKEAKRFPSKDNKKTAEYWEGIVDRYLESEQKNLCNTTLRILNKTTQGEES